MSTDLNRPSWVSPDDGWGPVTSPDDWNERTNRKHRRLVFVIVALAITLAATLVLAIVATLDLESTISEQRAALDDRQARLDLAEDTVVAAEADRDLAEEFASQETWRAEQCHLAADAATSWGMAAVALMDGDLDEYDRWYADTEAILDRGGFDDVGEAWVACDDLV